MAASTGDDVLPDTGRLQVGISGAGPAGLLLAIGLAQHGHSVTVLETLASPADRGTVNRDRSYPVDITARGMAALARFGVTADGSPLRRRTLPFYGHMTPWGPEALASAGLIGTRDDVVLGLLEFVGEHRAAWPGRVDVRHQVVTCAMGFVEGRTVLVLFILVHSCVACALPVSQCDSLYNGTPPLVLPGGGGGHLVHTKILFRVTALSLGSVCCEAQPLVSPVLWQDTLKRSL